MNHKQFFKAVADMRKRQKEYDKDRILANFGAKKLCEDYVDTEIERVCKILGIKDTDEIRIEEKP